MRRRQVEPRLADRRAVFERLLAGEKSWIAEASERATGVIRKFDPDVPVELHSWELPGSPGDYGLTDVQSVIVGPGGQFDVIDYPNQFDRDAVDGPGGVGADVVDLGDARRRLQGPEVTR